MINEYEKKGLEFQRKKNKIFRKKKINEYKKKLYLKYTHFKNEREKTFIYERHYKNIEIEYIYEFDKASID